MINWFPGHMAKSLRLIEENLKLIDVIIYVLDSRSPACCINPSFNSLVRDKPIIYILNKADLGSRSEVNAWTACLSTGKSCATAINALTKNSGKTIVELAKMLCKNKLEKYAAKGVKTSIKAMVIGVPNTGKSTIINNLANGAKTITGNKAGVTKGKQWVSVNDYFDVLDTPGTLYPKLTDQTKANHLAFIGSIKDEILDIFNLSLQLINELDALDENILKKRYSIDLFENKLDTISAVAKSRGYMLRGGELDVERAAMTVLDDFRKGRLGEITLDKAADFKLC